MPLKIKRIDLNTLEDETLWSTILSMTVSGWNAFDTFSDIKKNFTDIKATMLLLYDDVGSPVAWATRVKHSEHCVQIWAYTKPEARRLGYQRYLMKQARRRLGKGYDFQNWDPRQKKTFAHYVEA